MSWALASLIVLGAALACGFAWYERTQPNSRMLALVATLAALAAIGRVAFAPLPNVKPTTDIVLIAGFALGAAPGFTIGAVAALASNIVFGQGPWTPWQMVAWGLAGLAGAALGALTGREIGRVPLAVACGLMGLVFGAIMDLSVWVSYTGDPTLAQYVAISGVSLPFNVAHAAGNVVFALAFGPLLIRALLRYRSRLEVRWLPLPGATATAIAPPLAVALVVALGAAGVRAPAASASAPGAAASYLVSAQNADGGWGAAPGARSDPLTTAWTVIGLAAAGRDPARIRHGGRSAAALVRLQAPSIRTTGDLERTVLALAASGAVPGWLTARLSAKQDRDGAFDGLVNLSSFGVLALRAAGASRADGRVRRAASWIVGRQHRDGGFSLTGAGRSGIDDTAAAVEALATALGSRARGVRRGAAFLARKQNPDGGYPLQPGGASNAQSTAFAAQALLAAGRDPERQHRRGARSPLAYLRSLQHRNGLIRYSRTSVQTPVWVTAEALAALARRPLPIRRRG